MTKEERQALASELLTCRGFVLFEEEMERLANEVLNGHNSMTYLERYKALKSFKDSLKNELTNA